MIQTMLVVLGAAAFAAFVISRQVRQRRVTKRGLTILPVWFLALSLIMDHAMVSRLGTLGTATFFLGGVAFAAVMGVLRAGTLRVWQAEDGPRCEGGWRTGALWVATIAVRVGLFLLASKLGVVEGAGEAMVYVAVTLGVQNLVLARRSGLLQTPAAALPVAERLG